MAGSARITEIRLSADEAGTFTPFELCMWVEIFVRTAIQERGYEGSELPAHAHSFADLWTYYGEWRSGGHWHYTEYVDAEIAGRISGLLAHIGLIEHKALFDAFFEFASVNEDRLHALCEDGEEARARELFHGFDDRFHGLEKDSGGLDVVLRDWLVRQSWIAMDETVPHFTAAYIRQSIPAHPLAERRAAARLRLRHAETHGEMAAFLSRLRNQLRGKA